MRRAASLLADAIALAFLLSVWMVAYAIICPADAAEAVTLPVTDHALRHLCVIALLTVAAALVAVADKRRRAR